MNFSELTTPQPRRRAHEPPEVVTADRADRIGGVQCGMVDQLPAHGVCRCAAGSGRAGPVDREMKGERMWTKTKKKPAPVNRSGLILRDLMSRL